MTTTDSIKAALAKHPTARAIPVQNVAYWPQNPRENALNLEQDTRAYAWKGETLKAIRLVLTLQGKL